LDQLVALNDEIASLVRAGVPLESALAELGNDLPGELGRITTTLAERTSRGESLSEVLADPSLRLPPVYRAVVQAGLRSGRLSMALETLASSLRQVAETRRSVAAATIYPLAVLVVAWCLLALFASTTAPNFVTSFDRLEVTGRGLFGWLAYCGQWAGYWGPLLPLVILVLTAVWWFWSGQATMGEPLWAGRLLGWVPWVAPVLRYCRAATLAEVLGLLVESRVPLDDAMVLAAESTGDAKMRAAAQQAAEALRRGQRLDPKAVDGRKFPPLLRWVMVAGQRDGALLPALRHAAATYHQRARHQADMVRLFLPVALTLAIGGSVTLIYALLLFVPYTSMLKALGGM
jgi:general secretion pathway protein F